ncbi:MAG: DUF1080 domain-containing protein, partial [Verrucomicrobiales bacterium]|nr:DUF1080 domain-containing protein [Verrucomicrobiales bacterium]
ALYDLEDDVEETTDLAEQHPEIVERLQQLADEARRELGDVGRLGEEQRPAGWVDNVEAFRAPGLPAYRAAPTDAIPVITRGLGLANFTEASTSGWAGTSSVALDPEDAKQFFVSQVDGDSVLHNTFDDPAGKKAVRLVTTESYGDIDLHVEFLISEGSNSGVYLMGRYEVQILDSFGKSDEEIGVHDCGAIYERWNEEEPDRKKRGFEGSVPLSNASRPAGEWQSLDIVFRAPRFNEEGKKTTNATFVSVKLNGQLIHENEVCTGPTRGGIAQEAATGPLVFQGDHGPVALRNIWVRKAAE